MRSKPPLAVRFRLCRTPRGNQPDRVAGIAAALQRLPDDLGAFLRHGDAVQLAPLCQYRLAQVLPCRYRVVVGLWEQARGDRHLGARHLHRGRQRPRHAGVPEVFAILPRRLSDRGNPDRADRDQELHVGGAVGGQRRDISAFGLRPQANAGRIDVGAGAQQAQPGQRIVGQHRVVAVQQGVPHGPLVIDERHDAAPGEGLGLGA